MSSWTRITKTTVGRIMLIEEGKKQDQYFVFGR